MDSTRSRAATGWLPAVLLVTPLLRWVVLVHAVPAGQPWRTSCPYCQTPLAPSSVPSSVPRQAWTAVLASLRSWLILAPLLPAGRCRSCRRRFGAPAYLLELAVLAAAVLLAVALADGRWPASAAVALAGWALLAVALTFIDLAVHRLPDRLTLPAAGWVLAWLGLAAAVSGGAGDWLRAAAAAAACAGGFAAVTLLLGSRAFGLGDAKLALSAGALLGWLGWGAVVTGLVLAVLASGLVAAGLLLTRRVTGRDSLPFGPFLVAGVLAATAWLGAVPGVE